MVLSRVAVAIALHTVQGRIERRLEYEPLNDTVTCNPDTLNGFHPGYIALNVSNISKYYKEEERVNAKCKGNWIPDGTGNVPSVVCMKGAKRRENLGLWSYSGCKRNDECTNDDTQTDYFETDCTTWYDSFPDSCNMFNSWVMEVNGRKIVADDQTTRKEREAADKSGNRWRILFNATQFCCECGGGNRRTGPHPERTEVHLTYEDHVFIRHEDKYLGEYEEYEDSNNQTNNTRDSNNTAFVKVVDVLTEASIWGLQFEQRANDSVPFHNKHKIASTDFVSIYKRGGRLNSRVYLGSKNGQVFLTGADSDRMIWQFDSVSSGSFVSSGYDLIIRAKEGKEGKEFLDIAADNKVRLQDDKQKWTLIHTSW